MPEEKPGAGAAAPSAVADPQAPPILDADALLDGDGIDETAKYRISASKLKEVNELRKAFRAKNIDPAQAAQLLERWETLEQHIAAQQPAKSSTEPAKDAPAATPEQAKQKEEARKLFFDLFPEFKDVESTIKSMRELSSQQNAAIQTLYMDSHDHVLGEIKGMKLELTDAQVNDVEDLILNRIKNDKALAQRFYFGRNPMAVVTTQLKEIIGHLGHKKADARAQDAQLEAAKRRLAAIPPRVQGATPGPSGGGGGEPPRTVKEAGKLTAQMLRASRGAEE